MQPEPAPEKDLLRVHEHGWITRLREGTHQAAVAITLAGGYARDMEDTVTIHANTIKVAVESLR